MVCMTEKTELLKKSLTEALNTLNGYSLIRTDTLTQLIDDSDFLECLKTVGVDNWDGYDEAKEMFYDEE